MQFELHFYGDWSWSIFITYLIFSRSAISYQNLQSFRWGSWQHDFFLLLMTLWIMVIADGDKIIPPETCCVFCFCWCENRSYIISQIRSNTYKWMCCWNQFKRGNCLIKQNFMFAFSSDYFIHSSNNLVITR